MNIRDIKELKSNTALKLNNGRTIVLHSALQQTIIVHGAYMADKDAPFNVTECRYGLFEVWPAQIAKALN